MGRVGAERERGGPAEERTRLGHRVGRLRGRGLVRIGLDGRVDLAGDQVEGNPASAPFHLPVQP